MQGMGNGIKFSLKKKTASLGSSEPPAFFLKSKNDYE